MTVNEGVLRGLVRNWSRTLWAWSTEVLADDRSFEWPLTVQPGEVAAFEIEGWDGPADPALISFGVTAEMSNDMDLTRGFVLPSLRANDRAYWNCPEDREPRPEGAVPEERGYDHVPSEVLDDYPTGACLREQYALGAYRSLPRHGAVEEGLSGPSHPSAYGRLAPRLIKDLRAYAVFFDDSGGVADLVLLTPYRRTTYERDPDNPEASLYDENGDLVIRTPASVVHDYPPLSEPETAIDLLMNVDSLSEPFLLWIGGAHAHNGHSP